MSDLNVEPTPVVPVEVPEVPAVPGGPGVSDDVARLLKHNEILLAEKKAVKAENDRFKKIEADRLEAEAKERGEFDKVLKTKEEALTNAQRENKLLKIENRLVHEQIKDPEYKQILLNQVSDDMSNLDEVVTALKTQKPFLFGEMETPTIPIDRSKGAPAKPGKHWTREEFLALSESQRMEVWDEYDAQRKAGVIK